MNTQWQQITEGLKQQLEPGTFKVWIEPLDAKIKNGTLHLLAPNAYMAGWVKKRLSTKIEHCMQEVGFENLTLEIGVTSGKPTQQNSASQHAAQEKSSAETEGSQASRTEQMPLSTPRVSSPAVERHPSWRYCFSDFVEGASNKLAVAAAREVCRVNSDIQTLYLNALPGLGKTHLAQAVGQDISVSNQGQRVGYLTAEAFSSRYVASIKTHDTESFKEELRALDVLLLEDIHFFQKKPKIQETALSVVRTLQENGGRVIFTSSFSPTELKKVDREFFSNFCAGGVVAHIGRPDEAMRAEIISKKARAANRHLSDSVCTLIAQTLDGDVRQIEACLQSLFFKANLAHAEITKELAQEVLSEYQSEVEGPNLALLTSLVCESYGLDAASLNSRSRCQRNVNGRNTIFYLARKYTDLTLKEIGEPFNRRHSTVLQGITSIEKELTRNTPLSRQIAHILHLVEEKNLFKGQQ